MEENREPLSAIAIEKKLQLLRNKHFSEDTIALVKSDYEYGLKEEEISLYLNKSYDIEQMKILSECLHKDVPKDVIDIIKNTKYSVHQMQVSLEFYEKGVPVQTIKEVMDKGEKPITMRRLYEEVLEQLNNVKEQIPEESEYVKALISQMDEVVVKINHQNERYDALNKKLSEIETSKDDEEVRERLVKDNQEKDELINDQQNELNNHPMFNQTADGKGEPYVHQIRGADNLIGPPFEILSDKAVKYYEKLKDKGENVYIDSLTYEQFMMLGDAELSRRFSMQDEAEQKAKIDREQANELEYVDESQKSDAAESANASSEDEFISEEALNDIA